MYQETEDCDLKFVLNTFKYGLPRTNNGIYNSFNIIPPYTFDELLSWINEYACVVDDEITTNVGNNRKGGFGKFDNLKGKRKE